MITHRAGDRETGDENWGEIKQVVSTFAALHAWNDFLGPLLYLQDPNKYTLAVGLTFFSSQTTRDIQFNLLMAASTLVILPVVILFLSFQRFFVEGVTVTGLK